MREKYLGDSYDFVKRFWAEILREIAPLFAHPRFIEAPLHARFTKLVGMAVLDPDHLPNGDFGVFLDPHTGIPLPNPKQRNATKAHAPLQFIASEFERLKPQYMVCYDQSRSRNAGQSGKQQRDAKRASLGASGIDSFYYVSHAPFLFAAQDSGVLAALRERLVASGIPTDRFEPKE